MFSRKALKEGRTTCFAESLAEIVDRLATWSGRTKSGQGGQGQESGDFIFSFCCRLKR